MNESKILGRKLGEKKKNSFVPSAGAHILHWACEIVALKCVYIRNAWVIVPTQWSEIYSQWTSLLLLTSIMMLSWLRGHNWVNFPQAIVYCYLVFKTLLSWKPEIVFSYTKGIIRAFSFTKHKTKQNKTKSTVRLLLFKGNFMRNQSLSDARWFYHKIRKIGKGNLY